jgi:hypothetical protein
VNDTLNPKRALMTCALGFLGLGLAFGQTGGRAKQPSRTLPLTRFYDTSDPLPPGEPGQLIRSADFDQYNLPLEISAIRFLYYSRSPNGTPTASSGVILIPSKTAPATGWPVIAWAHQLTGVSRQCAPSLDRNLQHGPLLSMYVNLGYAVVATDYTGLGTNSRNAYADTVSNAWDVIDSVQAAHIAVRQLGSHWIAVGTGEGASAALKVAELETALKDTNFLGSIAITPSAELDDAYKLPPVTAPDEPIFFAYGLKTIYPTFNVGEILTDEATASYHQITQTCVPEKLSATIAAILRPNWRSNELVQRFFGRNRLGLTPARQPLFVIGTDINPGLQQTSKIVARIVRAERSHPVREIFRL